MEDVTQVNCHSASCKSLSSEEELLHPCAGPFNGPLQLEDHFFNPSMCFPTSWCLGKILYACLYGMPLWFTLHTTVSLISYPDENVLVLS